MARVAALGISDFESMTDDEVFYVDKTYFIKEWWKNRDKCTLITRPRRFGKTLTLSMVETFFSLKYAHRSDLFDQYNIWQDESFRKLQGTYPVIFLSLADVKQSNYQSMTEKMKLLIGSLFMRHRYLLDSTELLDSQKELFSRLLDRKGSDDEYMRSLAILSELMYYHHKSNVIILIDEYDTPMLEAYVEGFWEEAIVYIRRLFHASFKDNPYLERGLMTGITRITQESVFSDLNNLRVVTTTSNMYTNCFGFTEEEVFAALEEFDLLNHKEAVKQWYDGFQFGNQKDIYNPWSILCFLGQKKLDPYWMNTSSNALVGKLVREGTLRIKEDFEHLLNGHSIVTEIDESITYAQLQDNPVAVWSWFLTTGYLKIVSKQENGYEVSLTNYEVQKVFYKMVKNWLNKSHAYYGEFMQMLLDGNLEGMNVYMNDVIQQTFSYFDVSPNASENRRTEQFYHGFTLGLIADLNATHVVTSNRESGFGRYDVCIEPKDKNNDGIIIEFKIFDEKKESSLEDTAKRALEQIEAKNYETLLKAKGIANIRKYGFAFQGKNVLIAD